MSRPDLGQLTPPLQKASALTHGLPGDRLLRRSIAPVVGAAVRGALSESRWAIAAVAAQVSSSIVICGSAGRPPFAGPWDACLVVFGAAVVFGLLAFAIGLFNRRRRVAATLPMRTAYSLAWRELRADTLSPEYIANVLVALIVTPFAISAFSAAKQAIPFLHPFTWDARLALWGAALSGGHHLWQVLHPVLGHPAITVAMDWIYHRFWTMVLLGVFVWAAVLRPCHLRRRYLFAIVLVFLIVGNLGALAFASAGPAYFAHVVRGAADPYAPLLAYLHRVDGHTPLMSVEGERALWYAYTHRLEGFGYGVSAMPSVHVAGAVLTALFGYSVSRLLGLFFWLVAACTFVASVGLGWHYALDGYVGALLACIIWWFAGRVTREAPELATTGDYSASSSRPVLAIRSPAGATPSS